MGLQRLMDEMVKALTEEGERNRQVTGGVSAEGEPEPDGSSRTAREGGGACSSESEGT